MHSILLYKVQEKAKLIYCAGGRRWVISAAELTGTREAPWILEMAFLDPGDVSVHICRIHQPIHLRSASFMLYLISQ